MKHTLKKCFDESGLAADKNYTTWARAIKPCNDFIQSPIMCIMLVISRSSINADSDDDCYEALVARQHKLDKNYDTLKRLYFYSHKVYSRWGTVDPWKSLTKVITTTTTIHTESK